ncbi:MAG: hypothetical protein ACRD6X_13205 [Pyrinomonadaceae bacterium]
MEPGYKPKFVHAVAKQLVGSRSKRRFLGQPYLLAEDLLWLQSRLFEMCCVLGLRFESHPKEFLRVISADENNEQEYYLQTEAMFNRCVAPFLGEALGSIDLIFRSNSVNLNFRGDLSEYLQKFGSEKLPLEQSSGSIAAWGIKGGFAAIESPDQVDCLLTMPENIAFGIQSAFPNVEGLTDRNEISEATKELAQTANDTFDAFCIELYPEESKQLGCLA